MEKRTIGGHEAMGAYATEVVARIVPRTSGATVVALSGELGAGKTTFAQGVAKVLGVEETVNSPTFVIEKIYELTNQKWSRLIHIDAYRLQSAHELEVLGWHDVVSDPDNLILIEWPEMVASLIPVDTVRITLSGSGDEREVVIEEK